MAQYNAASTVSAWLKEIYADSLHNLVPEGVKLLKAVPFTAGDKELGDKYVQPVALTHEFGFSSGSGAFQLNDSIAATYAEAQVEGKNLLLRTAVSYDAMAKASSNKKSFVKWSEQILGNMASSFNKRLEILHLYGSTNIGTVSGLNSQEITVTAASFAEGIWAGSEGMKIDVYQSNGTVRRADLTVTSVNLTTRVLTVTGTATNIVSTDTIHFAGQYGAEMNGIDKIVTNSSTLYNISAGTYALWSGNSYAVGGALSFAKIQEAVALAVVKGLDEKVSLFCHPNAFADLNTDLAAARSLDGSYKAKKAENGSETITFYSINGEIEIIPSIYVKQGEAFIVPLKRLKRLGSSDVTMRMPGMTDEQLMLQLPSNAGYEMRLFYDGNLFCERPAFLVKLTGIS
jgi:hypothetical protein